MTRPPARVLMTADALGGVWTYVGELAGAFGRAGIRVGLAVMGGPLSAGQRRLARRVPGLEVYESDFRLEWMDDPWEDVDRAGEWLLDVAARVEPHVIHLNGYVHAGLPWNAPRLVVAHSCVLSWWRAVRKEDAPARYAEYRRRVTDGLRAADAVVFPTSGMRDLLEPHYGPLRNGRVIPNGRSPTGFRPGPKGDYVLTAGRLWDEAKNAAALERVARDLPWPVFAAGSAELQPSAAGLTAGERPGKEGPGGGARSGFRRLGELPPARLARWLAGASVFALPARYEPFGLAPLEAGLAGCALVLGDIPTLREVWRDGAMFVPPDDDDSLRRALLRLVEEPDLRRRMAARARRRALEYSPEPMAHDYMALYSALTAAGRGCPASAPTDR